MRDSVTCITSSVTSSTIWDDRSVRGSLRRALCGLAEVIAHSSRSTPLAVPPLPVRFRGNCVVWLLASK